MKRLPLSTLAIAVALLITLPGSRGTGGDRAYADGQQDESRILVFSKTMGWRHASIPAGIAAIQQLGAEHGFAVDATEDATAFTEDNLRSYQAVVFLNTTRNVLDASQQTAFERYIQAGGGFVGIHSAADTEYEWPWYGKLVGAYFANHPNHPNVRSATVNVTDHTHPATSGLPERWTRTDEWYSYRAFYPGIQELAYLDEETYDGGTNGAYHPIAWYHAYDGGRAFYTGGGHTDESFSEPLFLQHLLGGIQYAMGSGDSLDFSKAYSQVTPEENRFEKTVLVNDLNTPMEVAVAPDGRVFYTELDGTLAVYDPATDAAAVVHEFAVSRIGGTGLIGLTLDPNFEDNRFLYVYYSPPTEQEPIDFRLSRFTVTPGGTLDLASEKVLLTVPVQENSGAHHGGSLAWDKDGNLYLSTGDSSSPFPADGYAPLDERPGDEYYSLDAQRASANTNDLKGKILRIHPEPDGSYTIPEGNLFPPGTEKTRPEIYVMGLRNPYRIAVDPESSVLYWGEIGPDAGEDSERGPRGYDEFNQAEGPGNFGWPYFVGDNYAYADWDFATDTPGPRFSPEAPVNDSPNNTGLRELPPAQPPIIWYPYAGSEEFPELGEGGRSAMVGDFYTYDEDVANPRKFPRYYDGALFIFDWMRNWVLALRVDENDTYLRTEPFMASNGDFRRPIDLAFGPDGAMYMLEYGSVYGIDNDDARLVKIEYNAGNRPPVAQARIRDAEAEARAQARSYLTSDRPYHTQVIRETAGQASLEVSFSGRGTDPDDGDALSYAWLFDGQTVGSTEANATHTYTEAGVYEAVLKVTDRAGAVGTDTLQVTVGNTRPEVTITSPQNTSFFWEGQPFEYAVEVSDVEDQEIDPEAIRVQYQYSPRPGAAAAIAGGDQLALASASVRSWGETLIAGSDCNACHTVNATSVGPSYTAIAERYKDQEGAQTVLAEKIIHGGGGNWGSAVMSAHPQLSMEEAEEIVRYIFSLTDAPAEFAPVPPQGRLALDEHQDDEPQGRYTLVATYTDEGGEHVGPLTDTDVVSLRSATVETIYADAHTGFPRWGNSFSAGRHKAHILLRDIDLTGIRGFTYGYSAQGKTGEIEVRIDSYAGPVVSRTPYPVTDDGQITGTLDRPIEGRHDLYFIVRQPEPPNDEIITLRTITFNHE